MRRRVAALLVRKGTQQPAQSRTGIPTLDQVITDLYGRLATLQQRVATITGATGPAGAAGSDAVLDMTEKWQSLAVSTAEVWEEVDLSDYGVSDGDLVWLTLRSKVGGPLQGGAREVGSTLERRGPLHGEAILCTLPVVAHGAKVEVYLESPTDMVVYLNGYLHGSLA